MPSLRQAFADDLDQRIAAHDLLLAADLIHAASRETLRIYDDGTDDGDSVGGTRFGGEPDLPPDFLWPERNLLYKKTGFSNFLCQLNLAEVPDFAGREELPRSGLLSVFVHSMESAADPVGLDTYLFDPKRTELARRPAPPIDELVDEYLIHLSPTKVRFEAGYDCEGHERRLLKAIQAACPGAEDDGESTLDRFWNLVCELPSGGSLGQLGGMAHSHEQSDDLRRQAAFCRLGKRGIEFSDHWNSIEEYEAYIEQWRHQPTLVENYEAMRGQVEWLCSNSERVERRVKELRLLMRIDSNEPMNLCINDADPLYLFVRDADLAAGDLTGLCGEVTQG